MSDNARIETLRRRVDNDPASIAFAQLAEEYRRAGSYEEAVAACRGCLEVHPGYLSPRVTLGRALIETNQLDAADLEFTQVLQAAPENVAALRGRAQIHHRRGNLTEALRLYRTALALSRYDPALEQAVHEISEGSTPAPLDVAERSFDVANAEAPSSIDASSEETLATAEPPVLPQLERFLGAIHTYRQRRAV